MASARDSASGMLDRLRKAWKGEQEYEPLANGNTEGGAPDQTSGKQRAFSWIEYSIFLLLGVSMLWAWNMFLAAGPYFQQRFQSNKWIFDNFQAAEISVSTVTNLGSMLVLTRLQANASYPKRIVSSLIINMIIFALLALFTEAFTDITARGYFAFLMIMIFSTSLATGLCQNGIFAYVSGFGEPRYTQGIMMGQAIAGVLPCIAQIVSVLSVQASEDDPPKGRPEDGSPPPRGPPPVHPGSAFAYFLTATVISVVTLLAFFYLYARNRQPERLQDNTAPDNSDEPEERKEVPLRVLFRKLFWLASAVFVTFAITMLFPVFTQFIVSVRPEEQQPPILQPASFIPLAFLFWNVGDLLGRMVTAVPSLTLAHRPKIVLVLAFLRIGFLGLYHLCNIRGRGAIVESDFFYLVAVQLLFGLTNGYLGSTCMIGAGQWVEPEEREAAGGFMGLCLVGGLTVGSLASFFVAGA
ncbi:nucleoside transporter family [Hortaea werneckii]|uniref:Nucleoside transporter n=1 Tax=Hortaea werneckii TaxID=91943 RepID=A0A3M7FI82_HORWE|nr:nucleoside transporter family [Hortaea werneckii]RMY88558.1 hypothetical protein D0861_04748 [Hortaea werneckii]